MDGSWLGFWIFAGELMVLAMALGRDVGRRSAAPAPPVQPSPARDDRADDALDEDTRFLYEETVRYNDGFVQSIDALDNGLIAIAAGVIGMALFIGDKVGQLHLWERLAMLGILSVAATTCAVAYVRGPKDIGSRLRFIVDFTFDPAQAARRAIAKCAKVGYENSRLCARKRRAALRR
jgi:hypothetical protein